MSLSNVRNEKRQHFALEVYFFSHSNFAKYKKAFFTGFMILCHKYLSATSDVT
jgi:hypothetical protein